MGRGENIVTVVADEMRIAHAMHVVFEVAGEPEALLGYAARILAVAGDGDEASAVVEKLREIQKRVSGRVIDADCEQLGAFVCEVAQAAAR
jgi:hypothetical protein